MTQSQDSEAYDFILFGALGDLSLRKLFPALYQLERAAMLPADVRIAGVARSDFNDTDFRAHLKTELMARLPKNNFDEKLWAQFSEKLFYIKLSFENLEDYQGIANWAKIEDRMQIFYLAAPPSWYGQICDHLQVSGCLNDSNRVVLEKPIGHDLESSKLVNDKVATYFDDDEIFRIDHYLGKETVQNLLALRFANRFINAQWDRECIEHVQITAAETVGIEGRWAYYNKVGQMRDMVQNHLLQLLCLVAMEPPNTLTADGIRREKIKVLKALRPITEANVKEVTVRGQYAEGWVDGKPVPGYLAEEDCQAQSSTTESFVAIKAEIASWRWSGVPFYLRTGKRLAQKVTEIVITYKDQPHNIFDSCRQICANKLVIRLQPKEGIELKMIAKRHSLKERMALDEKTLNLDFIDERADWRIPDAYEQLLLDVVHGDQSLFVSREEVEQSWYWCDQIIRAWQETGQEARGYSAGSWGPARAELLLEKDGYAWYE